MEVAEVGMRTRARDVAVAMAAEETADNSGAVKRRKVGNEKMTLPLLAYVQTETPDRENFVNSAEEDPSDSCAASVSLRSGDVPASCCSSTGSIEKLNIPDLEEESVEPETVAIDRSESTLTSKFEAEPGELTTAKQSSLMCNSRRTVLPAEKMPPAAELEEFFAAAEKDLHKTFKDKYNYDFVNDVPLRGRFEWIQLKP